MVTMPFCERSACKPGRPRQSSPTHRCRVAQTEGRSIRRAAAHRTAGGLCGLEGCRKVVFCTIGENDTRGHAIACPHLDGVVMGKSVMSGRRSAIKG